jgi:hypothetical protein
MQKENSKNAAQNKRFIPLNKQRQRLEQIV